MTKEQIFKSRFPEYCAGEKCLSPYFDLFQIGFEEGENQNKELQALHKEIVDIQNECVSKLQIEIKQLQEENARLKKESETIIQDLLSNSDEYARQRAMDFLKGE